MAGEAILIAEDNPASLKLIRVLLAAADELFRVILVEDGKRVQGAASMDTSTPELR